MSEITHSTKKNTPAATGVSTHTGKAIQMLRKHISSPGVTDTLDQLRTTIKDKDMWEMEDIRPYISTVSRNTYVDHALAALDHLGNVDDHVHIEARGGGELYFLDREVFELVSQSLDASQEVQDYFAPPKPSIRDRLALVSQSEDDRSPFDRIRQVREDGSETWSARDLQELMSYSRWEDFMKIVRRAEASARNSGQGGFSEVTEKLSEGGRPRTDYELSRFAAYLVAMNGDPNKPEVAAAQAYFAVKTREAETQTSLPPSEDEIVAQALQITTRKMEELESKVQGLAPKAEYVNTYVAGSDHVRFSAVASTHGMREKDLRQLLVDEKWIYREETTRWSDTQKKKVPHTRYSEYAHKKPYFFRSLAYDVPRFNGEVMHTLKITAEGQAAIDRLIQRKRNALDLDVWL